MLPFIEIGYALRGLWRLLQFDPSGLEYFDRSVAGFWRSFRVALLIAPLYASLIPQQLEMIKPTVGWQQVLLVQILSYVVMWLLYPTVAYELCRLIGRDAEYPGYITVYNWSATILITASVLVWMPTFGGITTAETSDSLVFVIYHLFYVYLWFIARVALKTDPLTAVGLTFVDYVLGYLLSYVHIAMLKPPTGAKDLAALL
jgi:hypothetical protein